VALWTKKYRLAAILSYGYVIVLEVECQIQHASQYIDELALAECLFFEFPLLDGLLHCEVVVAVEG
jgi:hypothetical protein